MDLTILIFAAIAAFICYRLYTVLGTRGGHEPDEQEESPLAPRRDEEAVPAYEEAPAPSAAPQPEWADPVREVKPDFDAASFLEGAKAAYEMIVEAFASDRLPEVKPYVDPGVYRAFDTALKSRREAGQTSELNFVGIDRADVVEATVDNGTIRIVVDFRSDQVRVLRNAAGEVVEGDPNRIDLVRDRWTFARSAKSRDPNWMLVATGGSAPDAS